MSQDKLVTMNFFHPPSSNNNFNVYLRRDLQPELYTQYLLNLYADLNYADGCLKKWFEKVNKEQFHFMPVDTFIREWSLKLEKRQNLAGVFYARAIIKEFEKADVSICNLLQTQEPTLIENFIKLPEDLLSVSRINLCIPYFEIPTVLRQLSAQVFADPKIISLVERVETLLNPPPEEIVNYPTLVIYLDRKALRTQGEVNYLLEKLNNYFIRFPHPTQIDNTFADPWNSFVNVTQGFKLHKVYLTSLQVIDRVYSKESRFAYRSVSGLYKGSLGSHPIIQLLEHASLTDEIAH